MKYIGILLALLCLAPARADEGPPPPPLCAGIHLTLEQDQQNPLEWRITITEADGPWMLFFGTTANPVNYKGCTFYPVPVWSIGPISGDILGDLINTHGASMSGYWQCLSATQTSNRVLIP